MNISEIFIKRPVMTVLVMVTILVIGSVAYKKLPVSDLPNVDYPTIEVTVSYPGASPETMANTCATPLEREFMIIDGLTSMGSLKQTSSVVGKNPQTRGHGAEIGGMRLQSISTPRSFRRVTSSPW